MTLYYSPTAESKTVRLMQPRTLLLHVKSQNLWITLRGVTDDDYRLMHQIAEHEGREGWQSQALINVVQNIPRLEFVRQSGRIVSSLTETQVHSVCDMLPQEEIRLEEEREATEKDSKAQALRIAKALGSELVTAAEKGYDIRNGVLRELARRIGNRIGLKEPRYVSKPCWKPRGSPSEEALKAAEALGGAAQISTENLGDDAPDIAETGVVRVNPRKDGKQYTAIGLHVGIPGAPTVYALWNVDDRGKNPED